MLARIVAQVVLPLLGRRGQPLELLVGRAHGRKPHPGALGIVRRTGRLQEKGELEVDEHRRAGRCRRELDHLAGEALGLLRLGGHVIQQQLRSSQLDRYGVPARLGQREVPRAVGDPPEHALQPHDAEWITALLAVPASEAKRVLGGPEPVEVGGR